MAESKMHEDATQKQLDLIKSWGYDTVTTHYTKQMVYEIFMARREEQIKSKQNKK